MNIGYLHPSGRITCKKNWEYSDLYDNELKISGFQNAFTNFLADKYGLEKPSPTPPKKGGLL